MSLLADTIHIVFYPAPTSRVARGRWDHISCPIEYLIERYFPLRFVGGVSWCDTLVVDCFPFLLDRIAEILHLSHLEVSTRLIGSSCLIGCDEFCSGL